MNRIFKIKVLVILVFFVLSNFLISQSVYAATSVSQCLKTATSKQTIALKAADSIYRDAKNAIGKAGKTVRAKALSDYKVAQRVARTAFATDRKACTAMASKQPKIETPTPSFQLQSNFLKNDPTAKTIASGTLPNYDIRTSSYVYGGAGPVSTDNFGFKFLTAIRMLGYVKGAQTVGGQNMNEQILNRVERFNNLSVSPFIDKSVLKIIDSILVSRESLDSSSASNFPLYSHFINAPLNEPTKDHAAAVFSAVLGELPSSLVTWSEQNFKDYFRNQLLGRFSGIDSPNYQICDIAIYSELGDGCTAVVYSGTPIVNKIPTIITDDFDNATTIIHEYAHYLDRNIFSRNSATSQGLIDTTSFYAISYNLSDQGPGGTTETGGGGKTYAYKNPSNIKNEFVGGYAQGWQASDNSQHFTPYEDFAESFTMYVSEGKVFRKLSETYPVLKQKYDWLKQNVFQGQEYQSGDVAGIAAIKAQPTSTASATGAFNSRDYAQSLPNFVWNYKFSAGSLVPKP